VAFVLWQSKGDQCVVQGFFGNLWVSARSDDNVLLTIHTVGHRHGVAACRKLRLPKFLASLYIERANVRIEGISDEY